MNLLIVLVLLQQLNFNFACKTTVYVKDCKDSPVKGATVRIKKCDGDVIEYKTDKEGTVKTSLCRKAICDVGVIAQIENGLIRAIPDNCSGTDEDFICRFKLCSGY